MAQIRQVVSESLQATIRRLLPSQQGFTEDLQASNVIMPIIDLTPTAEGSSLDTDLARAIAFGSNTAFEINNTSTALANTAGFWRFIGSAYVVREAAVNNRAQFTISDGLSSKVIWGLTAGGSTNANQAAVAFDFVVFLDSGDSVTGIADVEDHLVGSYRQIADLNGNIVNPAGFQAS